MLQPSTKVDVDYEIEYNDPSCSNATAPDSVEVRVRRRSTALTVMETVVDNFGRPYRFSATYFGGELGYFIDSINGTASDPESNCFWFIFIRAPNGTEFLSPLGVSNFRIPGKDYGIIWRFMTFNFEHN